MAAIEPGGGGAGIPGTSNGGGADDGTIGSMLRTVFFNPALPAEKTLASCEALKFEPISGALHCVMT